MKLIQSSSPPASALEFPQWLLQCHGRSVEVDSLGVVFSPLLGPALTLPTNSSWPALWQLLTIWGPAMLLALIVVVRDNSEFSVGLSNAESKLSNSDSGLFIVLKPLAGENAPIIASRSGFLDRGT